MLSPTTQKLSAPGELSAALDSVLRQEAATLDAIVGRCAEEGVLLARAHSVPGEPFPARPLLKLHVTLRHSEAELQQLVAVLKRVAEECTY